VAYESRLELARITLAGPDGVDPGAGRAAGWGFRSAAREGVLSPDRPANYSGVEGHNGKLCVVLRNVNGILAVYRVRNDGVLNGLRR